MVPWSGNKPEVQIVAEVAVYCNHSEARPQLNYICIFAYSYICIFSNLRVYFYVPHRLYFCDCCIFFEIPE